MHIPCNERACLHYDAGECKLHHAGTGGDSPHHCRCFYFKKRTNT